MSDVWAPQSCSSLERPGIPIASTSPRRTDGSFSTSTLERQGSKYQHGAVHRRPVGALSSCDSSRGSGGRWRRVVRLRGRNRRQPSGPRLPPDTLIRAFASPSDDWRQLHRRPSCPDSGPPESTALRRPQSKRRRSHLLTATRGTGVPSRTGGPLPRGSSRPRCST